MVAALAEPAATVVLTAAFTGFRRGELRGMRGRGLKPVQQLLSLPITSASQFGTALLLIPRDQNPKRLCDHWAAAEEA